MRADLLSYLYENASREDIAVSFRRRLRRSRWSYARLARTAFRFARELEGRGIGKGDHVVIWGQNCPEWVAAFWGSLLRGAVVVPIDERSTDDLVRRIVGEVDPKLLLYGSNIDCLELGLQLMALEDLPGEIGGRSGEIYPAANISGSDPVEVVFTSGTTGEPKGVVLTHENILANIEAIETVVRRYSRWEFLVHPIRVLCLLPLSHVFGQVMGIFVPHLLGLEVIFQDRLDPAAIVETIRRERVSVLSTVPRILDTLRDKVRRDEEAAGRLHGFDRDVADAAHWGVLKKWRRFWRVHRMFGLKFWSLVSGGAALAGDTEEFWRRLGFVVVQGYGMTETAALVSLNNPFKLRSGSLGQVLAGQEVKIDESGEILVRGKNVSAAAGAQKGWLRTGDIGSLDETGRLYFKGRKKDVIVTAAGMNVYPEDIEAALARQPEVLQSVAFGLEGKNGEEPAAALILKPGSSAEEAVRGANSSLSPHQRVRRWTVWSEPDFPRTATMKVRRNVVADAARRELSGGAAATDEKSSVLDDVLARIGARKRGSISAGTRLTEDLGLDSLSRVELLSAVEERFHIDVDEQAFTTAETVGEIELLIRAEKPPVESRTKFSFPRWPLRAPVSWLRVAFYRAVTLPITKILCRVRVRGLENLAGVRAPVLFASNHVTEIDAALIMSAMPARFRGRLAIAMDGERLMSYRHAPPGTPSLTRLRTFFQYWLATAMFNVFPLPRRSGFRRSFEFAGEAMDAGYNVLIFPEGEITKDGRMQKLRRGVGLLAGGLEAATVPVKISGLYELRKAGRRFFAPPGSVTITFGEPVPFDPDLPPESMVDDLERLIGSGPDPGPKA